MVIIKSFHINIFRSPKLLRITSESLLNTFTVTSGAREVEKKGVCTERSDTLIRRIKGLEFLLTKRLIYSWLYTDYR